MTTSEPGATTVLLTGAAGTIGTALRAQLPALGWRLRCFDRQPVPSPGPDDVVGELGDRAALARALDGVDAVVHLAGQPTEAPWSVIRDANIDGLVAVFDAARHAGIRRVVYASSNHATGFTPMPTSPADPLPTDAPPRPDTLYGVSKVFGEALARYHVDRYDMQVACLRIGTFAPEPPDVRALSTWLSPADCTRLVDACLRARQLRYALVWGISANTRRAWSLEPGRALGYEPLDDAEDWVEGLADPEPAATDALVGGPFTGERYGIDAVAERAHELDEGR